jgi:hypothetical protein
LSGEDKKKISWAGKKWIDIQLHKKRLPEEATFLIIIIS